MEQMQRSYEERIDDEVPTHRRAFTEGERKRDFETVTKSGEDYEEPKDHSSHSSHHIPPTHVSFLLHIHLKEHRGRFPGTGKKGSWNWFQDRACAVLRSRCWSFMCNTSVYLITFTAEG